MTMKVKNLKTGAIEEHGPAYAARLIEQGYAVASAGAHAAEAKPSKQKPRKAAAAAAAEIKE